MRIEYEAKPDGMAHVHLLFRESTPDAEDFFVTYLLRRLPTPPKRTFDWEREGEPYRVLQYGECVLAPAMYDIEKHVALIERLRADCAAALASTSANASQVAIALSVTAVELHQQARLTLNEGGRNGVRLDDEQAMRAQLIERLRKASEDATATPAPAAQGAE